MMHQDQPSTLGGPVPEETDRPRGQALRVVLRILLAHAFASYPTAVIAAIAFGFFNGWHASWYILAPFLVAPLVLVELLGLVLSVIGLGWEWTWTEPAMMLGIYAGLFALSLGVIWLIGRAIQARRGS